MRLVCTGLLLVTSLFIMLVLAELEDPLVADTDLLMAPLSNPPVPDRPNGAAANKKIVLVIFSNRPVTGSQISDVTMFYDTTAQLV